MSKWVCKVCGYIFEGEALPEDFRCPVCKAPASKFEEMKSGELTWACEHEVGVGKAEGVSEDIIKDLRANFEGECSEVGMYLAMARVAFREGYPEVGMYYEKAAYEEAEHAAKFAELLGIKPGETTEDGLFTLDVLRCIGACAIAPAVSINGKVYPQLKVDNVSKVIDEYRAMEA